MPVLLATIKTINKSQVIKASLLKCPIKTIAFIQVDCLTDFEKSLSNTRT